LYDSCMTIRVLYDIDSYDILICKKKLNFPKVQTWLLLCKCIRKAIFAQGVGPLGIFGLFVLVRSTVLPPLGGLGRQRSNAWTRPRIQNFSLSRSPAEHHFAKTPGFYELVAPTSPRLSNDQFPVPTQYSQPIASTTTADSGPAHCGCDDSNDRRRQSQ
jgi:hypothetical protein